MIEVNIDTIAVEAAAPPEKMIEEGAPAKVHLQVVGGNELPFADPQRPDRPVVAPALAVNFQLGKSAALEFAALIKSEAESLPDDSAKSKLVQAKNLSEVNNVVDIDRKLRQGK